MAAIDRAVKNVIPIATVTIMKEPISPTLPTTHPNRRYMITPISVSTEGVKTPPNVPSPPFEELITFFTSGTLPLKGTFIYCSQILAGGILSLSSASYHKIRRRIQFLNYSKDLIGRL